MAWNEPGNKGNDPWGGKKNQGPPDLDDVLKNIFKRFGNGKGNMGGTPQFNNQFIGLILGAVVAIWFISGFYTVKEAERGVVLRFGKYVDEVDPGLHWKPTFIDNVIPIDINNTRTQPASGSMLTQDENVVRVEMEVQYRVTNPYHYLFSVTDANSSLREAVDSALRYVIGHNIMDDILTTGREKIRQDTRDELQRIVEPYQLGLTIVDVNFLPARPPEEVKDAFDDAISAQEDEERYIREAEAYAREKEPIARGLAKRMEQDAIAYSQRVELEAEGKVARFLKLLPEYRAAPNVTRDRLYIEAMAAVFLHTTKVLVDTKGSGNMLYLPLDKIISKSNQVKSNQAITNEQKMNNTITETVPSNPASFGRSLRGDQVRQGRN
ncbi:MAG: FtsH protease activity modulator HflK [Shewanellaceae bacterium]|nr:FtsH protease activity modulator HflK [Shewanellaceae bacterium]